VPSSYGLSCLCVSRVMQWQEDKRRNRRAIQRKAIRKKQKSPPSRRATPPQKAPRRAMQKQWPPPAHQELVLPLLLFRLLRRPPTPRTMQLLLQSHLPRRTWRPKPGRRPCGSIPRPASITSRARAGTGSQERQIHDGSRCRSGRLQGGRHRIKFAGVRIRLGFVSL
jgi:hypothetical protein